MAQEIIIPKQDPEKVSPLNLAFIGDSVYEVLIRNAVIYNYNGNLNEVNRKVKNLVMASAQCKIIHAVSDMLTDHEISVFKRGRNAKGVSSPKNCSISEYRDATGLEALVGYLYLKNDMERAWEIVSAGINAVGQNIYN